MLSKLDPRRVGAYAIVAILVGILAVNYVRAVGPAARRERIAACAALGPTPFNTVLGSVPRAAPSLAAQAYTGEMVSLSAYRARVVFLHFWAPWCDACNRELPTLSRLQADLHGEAFNLLTLVSEPTWKSVLDHFPKGTDLTVLLDPPRNGEEGRVGSVAARFGTDKLPESYLIDKAGTIRYYFVGARDWSSEQARTCVQSLIDE